MKKLNVKENLIAQAKKHNSSFTIEPLDASQSITLGNTLRRILFTKTPSLAAYAVEINDIKNEFDSLVGLREDILEVIVNLKEIVYSLPSSLNKANKNFSGYLFAIGPKIITAKLFNFPKNTTRVINSLKYIGTLTEKKPFYLELKLKIGNGYNYEFQESTKQEFKRPSLLLPITTNFCPIKNVTYLTNLCYNNNGLLKESLTLNIQTNGSCTPGRCLFESLKYLNSSITFLTNNFNLLI